MYLSFNDCRKYPLVGRDEELGDLHDVYIDTDDWTIDYFVVDTGGWFSSNKVLVHNDQKPEFDAEKRELRVDLRRSDIEAAPPAGSVDTVKDQQKGDWDVGYGSSLMLAGYPGAVLPYSMFQTRRPLSETEKELQEARQASNEESRRHLRSAAEIVGYDIHGSDGDLGSVSDLIVDPESWTVRWLVIDTGKWLPGRQVVISPRWASQISWPDRSVSLDMTKQKIKESPPLESIAGLERNYETLLQQYYGMPWY